MRSPARLLPSRALSPSSQASDTRKLFECAPTVQHVLRMPKRKLEQVKGISSAKAEKIQEAATKLVGTDRSFQTAKDLQAQRDQNVYRVTTGCVELDEILGGGVESGSITELYGEWRCGKTQLCLTLCVTSFLPREVRGGEGRALFLDTEGTFRPERLGPIAARFELDHDFVMENVVYERILNCDHLDARLNDAAALFADEETNGPFRVLVVDSIIAPFRQEFPGRGELAERQQRIGAAMAQLKIISEVFNVAVIITNQVTADPGAAAAFVADPKKAVGGNIIAHISDTRLSLRKGKGEQRVCKVVDSPMMPEAEATFAISPGGITNAE